MYSLHLKVPYGKQMFFLKTVLLKILFYSGFDYSFLKIVQK